jgi:UDP-3-O-[3-hydroxymyristoyl] N-acetylglucosamine deacetylase
MQVQRPQQTIARLCHVSGRGYWSGTPITVTFRPADENTGIVFRRVDLPGQPQVVARAGQRLEAALRTRLADGEAMFDMIEHIMSALYALEIDNCYVDCSAREMPGMDGSSLAYALALDQAGIVAQNASANVYVVDAPHRIGDDRQWIMLAPSAQPGLTCEYRLNYAQPSIIPSDTHCATITPATYIETIAPARTFVTQSEAEELQAKGLASHVTYRELLVFGTSGPIDNALRFDDECARHKLLDLVGDLALCGVSIHGKVTAYRSGHILNGRMAEWIEQRAAHTYRQPLLQKRAA